MSNVTKKTVRIKESELVDLIDNILNEAVTVKKQEWFKEEAKKQTDKTTVLESKIAKLEAAVKTLTESKKK
jgi:hypothetical protein